MTELVASDAQESQESQDPRVNGDELPHSNGHKTEDAAGEEEPPAKRRRVSGTTQIQRAKPESPPWKKAVAEGPSSFTQDGIRKSGRTNLVPFELQPQSGKRRTRGAVKKTDSTTSKPRNSSTTNSLLSSRDIPATNGTKMSSSSSQHLLRSPAHKTAASPKRPYRKSMPSEPTITPVRAYKKSTTRVPLSAPQTRPAQSRRSGRTENTQDELAPSHSLRLGETSGPSPKTKLSKIKFRVKPASLPYTHAGLVLPRPKLYSNFREYIEKSAEVPVAEGGLRHPDEALDYTPEIINKDAQLILRMEEAAEPGGVLSPAVCSIYQAEENDVVIPKQYAYQDHMNRAAVEFRKLMSIEQKKHRASAKRLAEACRDEWYRRQPKTSEQIEIEETRASQARYKLLVKTLQATWENVKAEVNRRRVLEWEVQEQIRVRKALNEAVDLSTQKLQARRAHMDSEASSDEDDEEILADGDNPESDPDTDERESNMSSSESEADEEFAMAEIMEDENLSVEQLRAKYATLSNLRTEDPKDAEDEDEVLDPDEDRTPEPEPATGDDLEDDFDDSDESIDMGDDMGDSDDDESEDSIGAEDDDDNEDPGESSLLGLLAPSELISLKSQQAEKSSKLDDDSAIEDSSLARDLATSPSLIQPLDGAVEPAATNPQGLKQTMEATAISPDHSSQPTPITTETRQSDVDSASSVDPQRSSRQITESATPQPGINFKTKIPELLRGELREYQRHGLDWLANLYANNTNGILADEMGLGKTIQTIALLAHLACDHQVWGPHLIIVPTSVILNWEMEFKKWCPGFKVLTYYGNQEERLRKRRGWRDDDLWNVCITSYQLILQDQQVFKRRRWHYMILDEAHNIKNFQSQRWQTMLTFQTQARLLLTGTPLQNNLTELWSLLYFLMPSDGTEQGVGGFANLKEFQDWFKKPSEQILEHGRDTMDDESKAIITKLHKVLRPYLLRRLKADVEKQMPGKYEHVEFCRLSKRQRELYDGFLSRDETRETLGSGNYLSIITCLMQLRKVCNHPDLFVERAISTSFPMNKSAAADFEIKELLLRRGLLREDPMTKASLEFLNLVPANHERFSDAVASRSAVLTAQRSLMDMRETQRLRAQKALTNLDPSTAKSNLVYLESASRWGRFEELQHCVYLNALRRQQKPLYGTRLVELLTIGAFARPLKPRPNKRKQLIEYFENYSPVLESMVQPLAMRSETLKTTIEKFACVTPPVVSRDVTHLLLTSKGVKSAQEQINTSKMDPYHEARMRLSIQFPDKRLLQYDCGKLQTLDRLLRKLQAGGHRALIFTQMTRVLDILEQFLNIHGHKYLRLDGSTKIEQRQILTDRFNSDDRILAFILSSRSGGLGINLTGADTVIFYDMDWNPAMDAQCQDRCHRIGQTRDVHIYRLVSEHTIEANILRKANQKRMLDDVVIQEGAFTTDYFNKINVQDGFHDKSDLLDGDAFANAAMDRVLGGVEKNKEMQRAIAQGEDKEDVAAARVAEKEIVNTDALDFDDNIATNTATPAGAGTPLEGAEDTPVIEEVMELGEDEDQQNAWGESIKSTDEYMLMFMMDQLRDTPVELPKDKSKSKKGKDHRLHRAR